MSNRASGMPTATISVPNSRKKANGSSANLDPAVSVSPTLNGNLHARLGRPRQPSIHQLSTSHSSDDVLQPRVLRPFATGELRLLLLENISQRAVQSFQQQGFQVDHHTKAWSEDELLQKIGQYHAIGIRSKTRLTAKVLKAATKVSFFDGFRPRRCALLCVS